MMDLLRIEMRVIIKIALYIIFLFALYIIPILIAMKQFDIVISFAVSFMYMIVFFNILLSIIEIIVDNIYRSILTTWRKRGQNGNKISKGTTVQL